jgi:predicted dehydrogenase
MPEQNPVSRRQFLQGVAAAGLAGPVLLRPALGADKTKANDRLTLGFIGVGTMGRHHLNDFLRRSDVQVVAVCDVVEERRGNALKTVEDHYAKQKKGTFKGCKAYNDFRDLLARTDIDAVVIATPDHWHAIPCVLAAKAGKHIYCEKPLTLAIAQGRKIVEAVRKHKVVFQTGSQQRSAKHFGAQFRTAVELIRNGRIGKVKTVRIGVGDPAVPCDLREEETPKGTDWNLWLGPAPKRGYNHELCPKGVHTHFPAWRRYREYAGGGLADMGAHHFDIAQWALDTDRSGPVKIEPPPDRKKKSGLKFTYASGVVMYHGGPTDCVFEGSDGTISVSRGGISSKPAKIVKEPLGKDAKRVYHSDDHAKNWLECIRSRKETICPAEVGQRSAAICHLANIGYQLRRALTWDPEKERFVDDAEANKLVDRALREPWQL